MHEIVERAFGEGRNLLEPEALALLGEYGLPVPRHEHVRTPQAALAAARRIGYPVVLKVVSRDIVHKSEVGGVRIGVAGDDALKGAWEEISRSVEAAGGRTAGTGSSLEGFLVCEQASAGVECIIGSVKDPQFGPAVMFGLGGIFVELIKDAAFRVLPITRQDANELIRETKSYKVLCGMRGQKRKDIEAAVDCLMNTAALVRDNPVIAEIDINPLVVFERGAMVLDARVLLQIEG